MKKFLVNAFQVIGVMLLTLIGLFIARNMQFDDANMVQFKQSLAGFIASDKQSASAIEVLGKGGNRICMRYPYRMDDKTVKTQLLKMFPARAAEIEKLGNKDRESDLVIGIEGDKGLTVMTGGRKVIVNGKSRVLVVARNGNIMREEGGNCFDYATVKFSKTEGSYLLFGDLAGSGVTKVKTEKPKQKKKPAPAPEKKTTKPARSYGY